MPDPGTSPAPILYLGDTFLHEAASYLAGVMHRAGLGFDYVPSDASALDSLLAGPRKLIILSDYPAASLEAEGHNLVASAHENGAGLLMIGGWESYHGLGGDWDASPVAKLLPALMSDQDDRINHDQPAFVRRIEQHPAVDGLPWDDHPPCIGGYNRFTARPGAQTLLEVVRQCVAREGDAFRATGQTVDPMLVVDDAGPSRAACLATDAAPHWVGPLVDWGTDNTSPSGAGRVDCHAPGAEPVQVGEHYARFFTQLVQWCMGER